MHATQCNRTAHLFLNGIGYRQPVSPFMLDSDPEEDGLFKFAYVFFQSGMNGWMVGWLNGWQQ